ncbi:hypothetical protein OsJ_34398 [Oryza sativa Japonica Group]|uniref:Uncharacterized protein n=1 Tax=Oryza sativa subsp. japonica TaxID=39947 RepID=B9G886_ORYSJ|nr:hypothetical protein OsJ_34398 [Oryza sativa Japonica Group]
MATPLERPHWRSNKRPTQYVFVPVWKYPSCPSLEVPQLSVRSRGLTAWRSTSRKSSDNYCCFLEMKATSDHLVQKGNINGIDLTKQEKLTKKTTITTTSTRQARTHDPSHTLPSAKKSGDVTELQIGVKTRSNDEHVVGKCILAEDHEKQSAPPRTVVDGEIVGDRHEGLHIEDGNGLAMESGDGVVVEGGRRRLLGPDM